MTKYWHEGNPDLYTRTREAVESRYSTLRFEVRDRIVFVVGSFPIKDDAGVVDTFDIEIEVPPNFPKRCPTVREVGGRLPKTVDRHMLQNGDVCLFVQEDWWVSHAKGYTLQEFLDGPVRAYFVGQSMVELGMEWPFGERSHGIRGILECYRDLTGAASLETAFAFLALLAEKRLNGRRECPCGSGSLLRHCHMPVLLELRSKIPWRVSHQSWLTVVQYDRQHAAK